MCAVRVCVYINNAGHPVPCVLRALSLCSRGRLVRGSKGGGGRRSLARHTRPLAPFECPWRTTRGFISGARRSEETRLCNSSATSLGRRVAELISKGDGFSVLLIVKEIFMRLVGLELEGWHWHWKPFVFVYLLEYEFWDWNLPFWTFFR